MNLLIFPLQWGFLLLTSSLLLALSSTVEYTFNIENTSMQRLCHEESIVVVNGSLPGPTIDVREGDTVIVHVLNQSPYNITIHWTRPPFPLNPEQVGRSHDLCILSKQVFKILIWNKWNKPQLLYLTQVFQILNPEHGVYQLFNGWADGTEYVTQCGIVPRNSYTYTFNVTGQEGTLWWHAHSFDLRGTVYGAFIIRPPLGSSYPFPQPYQELPILFETYKMNVTQGKTYLLRMMNAALDSHFFFKLANHSFTVVAVDASYTVPYHTDILVIAPGQTVDALFTANQSNGSYYMAASPYNVGVPAFDKTTTRGIVVYGNDENETTTPPVMPVLPVVNDTATAFTFYSNLTSLVGAPHWVPVPLNVDERMFITVGLGLEHCPEGASCSGPNGEKYSASMNNESFVLPKGRRFSMLEAFYYNMSGVFTTDFPDHPVWFDFTNESLSDDVAIMYAPKSTKAKRLKFNSTVEIVYQNTALLYEINHPMHIHGYSFYVLAQGFGDFNPRLDQAKYNLINPQIRNTIAVSAGGWAVIRFQANNPGVWFVHCHVDDHLEWGLDMTFEVENGPTPSTSLPPPPIDMPECDISANMYKCMLETNNTSCFL
nr:laccase-7 isoform X2 [Arachis hypogaea]